MQKIAVIWDLDGTIVDSAHCFQVALAQFLKKNGFPFTVSDEEYRKKYFGMAFKEILLRITGGEIEPEKIDAYVEDYFSLSIELVKQGLVTPIPGVEKILKMLKERSVPMAIGSSSNLNMIITELQAVGYLGYFTNIISGGALPSKPAPNIFLVAAQSLHCEPQNCIVIEDSIAGIHSANNAGIKCIGITTTRSATDIQDADLIIDSFDQLTFGSFETLILS